MELPHLGQHCSEGSCNRLDFLPLKCDSCRRIFCSEHFSYACHSCPNAKSRDAQVPVCPLCGEPVPTAPGIPPDLTVGQHIDKQCKSDTKKIFTNSCNYKGCKRKELIPVICEMCHRNYCLRHRHFNDHECKTRLKATSASSMASNNNAVKGMTQRDQRTMAANAAEYRRTNKPTSLYIANPNPSGAAAVATASTSQHVENLQGNMTEDEALARALALSIMELDESADRNRRNEAASATATTRRGNATVPVGGRDEQTNNSKDKCSVS